MTTTVRLATLTPEDIARLLPPSWAYTFADLKAALCYHHPTATIVDDTPATTPM